MERSKKLEKENASNRASGASLMVLHAEHRQIGQGLLELHWVKRLHVLHKQHDFGNYRDISMSQYGSFSHLFEQIIIRS
jgi:hypothetical protein